MIPPLPWKLIGRIAVPVLVLLVAWWQIRSYADRVADGREAEIRALWEADTAARDKVAAKAIADSAAREKVALERNRDIEADYLAKLAVADAGRDDTLRLLQRARDQVRAIAASEATGQRGLDALSGVAARAAEVDRRLVEYDASCRRDSVRFGALQEQIRGQL
jgi:hypothetical protein